MLSTRSIGAHWLAPTWTLAVEEHFNLVIAALIVFTPQGWLVSALITAATGALCLRTAVYIFGVANEMAALAVLPEQMDILVCGMLAAAAMGAGTFRWETLIPALRLASLGAPAADLVQYATSPKLFGVLRAVPKTAKLL